VLPFFWKNKHSVGVRELDEQHKIIMQCLDELHEELMRGKINQPVALLLDNLMSLAKEHFATEEKLMASTEFPELDEHRASHQDLMERIENFISWQVTRDPSAYCQFMYFVREWMIRHMVKDDQKFGPWLVKHGIS
jgi:hemerythrin